MRKNWTSIWADKSRSGLCAFCGLGNACCNGWGNQRCSNFQRWDSSHILIWMVATQICFISPRNFGMMEPYFDELILCRSGLKPPTSTLWMEIFFRFFGSREVKLEVLISYFFPCIFSRFMLSWCFVKPVEDQTQQDGPSRARVQKSHPRATLDHEASPETASCSKPENFSEIFHSFQT